MKVYHSLSLACLGGSILLLVISAFLFIRLEIRTAWSVLTGRKGKERTRGQADLRRRDKKRILKQKAGEEQIKEDQTMVLEYGDSLFHVEREIMLIYTEERIDWSDGFDSGEKE